MKRILFSGARIDGFFANVGLLVFRLALGLGLALGHGLAKLPGTEGHTKFMQGVEGLWKAHDLPAATLFAYAAIAAEVAGAFLLAAGLLTRIGAFLIVVNMSVAFFLVHQMDPFSVKEMAFLYGTGAVLFLFVGAGKFSLDAFLNRP